MTPKTFLAFTSPLLLQSCRSHKFLQQRCRSPIPKPVTPPRQTPYQTAATPQKRPPTIKVGDIVAAQLSKNSLTVARVTGVASSGDTIDITPLEEFVRELYVEGKAEETYARAELVRPVRAEYIPSQQGWIVLNDDLQPVKNYFNIRETSFDKAERTVVIPADKPELSPEALQKQLFPKPTKGQAFAGAALSLPVAAAFYATFGAARDAYLANPAGEELLSGEVFRNAVLFTTFGAAVSTLLVGAYLLVYALSGSDESTDE